MTYATLMVHLEPGHPNAGLLQIAAGLAERFHAGVIGIAACEPIQLGYGDGYVTDGAVIEQDLEEIEQDISKAEAEFRGALQTRVENLEWRSTVTRDSFSDYLAREARCADLVITGVASSALLDASRRLMTSDLVMQVGRPVLIVPAAADKLILERAIVGWKDTREARRAAFDALPLLKQAAHVVIVEIAVEEELAAARSRLDDVVGWLKRHGVEAEPLAAPSTGDDATGLNVIAQEQGADIVVAGAYGHSRLREWALGGVTADFLLRPQDRCSLISH